MRFAHISDVHVTARPLGWRLRDCFDKRLTSLANWKVHRASAFADAQRVLEAFDADLRARGVDQVVFTGDASALGFEPEMRQAAAWLGVGRRPGLATPGNHDLLTRTAARSGAFERSFAPWQTGRRVDREIYPFAQPLGEGWLIAVNSARPNRLFFDASGVVGEEQRRRLRQLLAELPPGPRIVATHYPIALADGRREPRFHGLVDLDPTLDVALAGGVVAWLHGHRHGAYALERPLGRAIPAFCAGTGTQAGLASYLDCVWADGTLKATRRVYRPASGAFVDGPLR